MAMIVDMVFGKADGDGFLKEVNPGILALLGLSFKAGVITLILVLSISGITCETLVTPRAMLWKKGGALHLLYKRIIVGLVSQGIATHTFS